MSLGLMTLNRISPRYAITLTQHISRSAELVRRAVTIVNSNSGRLTHLHHVVVVFGVRRILMTVREQDVLTVRMERQVSLHLILHAHEVVHDVLRFDFRTSFRSSVRVRARDGRGTTLCGEGKPSTVKYSLFFSLTTLITYPSNVRGSYGSCPHRSTAHCAGNGSCATAGWWSWCS